MKRLIILLIIGTIIFSSLGCGSPTGSSGSTSVPSPEDTIDVIDSTGVTDWARTTESGSSDSYFNGITSDNLGNLYAVGSIKGIGNTYNFGNSITTSASYPSDNLYIVKYNSSGLAQWVRTAPGATQESFYKGVATDSSNNIYAVGYFEGTGTLNFGNSVTVEGIHNGKQLLIAKYNSSGVCQWAKNLISGSASEYCGVSVDTNGDIYAVGNMYGENSYNFDNIVSILGPNDNGYNQLIVKYNTNGEVQWAKTTESGSSDQYFNGVSTDSSNNVYAVGSVLRDSEYTYGNGVSVTGPTTGGNQVIVKYNSAGTAQWAKVAESASGGSSFYAVTCDSSNNIIVAGYIRGTSQNGYGNSVTIAGPNSSDNLMIIKYNSSGVAQWAKTLSSGSSLSNFYGVSTDSTDNIYAAGYIRTTSEFNFGEGVLASGASAYNNLLCVKYNSSGVTQWASTTVSGASTSNYKAVNVDKYGYVVAVGDFDGDTTHGLGNSLSIRGSDHFGDNICIVKYK